MVTANILQKRYKSALLYEQKRLGGKLGQRDQRYTRVRQNGLYHLREVIIIVIEYLSRAASASEKTVSSTSLAVDFVKLFKRSAVQYFMAPVHAIAE